MDSISFYVLLASLPYYVDKIGNCALLIALKADPSALAFWQYKSILQKVLINEPPALVSDLSNLMTSRPSFGLCEIRLIQQLNFVFH